MRKGLFFSAAALVLFVTSCKKEDKVFTATVQNLAGTYKLSKVTVQSGSSAEVDYTSYIEDCLRDDELILNSNLTYKNVDAGVSCGNGDDTGSWSLTNSTTIVIDGETSTIRKFDGKNLELTQSETINGMTATAVSYMVKQ